jgi:hypothetical protein
MSMNSPSPLSYTIGPILNYTVEVNIRDHWGAARLREAQRHCIALVLSWGFEEGKVYSRADLNAKSGGQHLGGIVTPSQHRS